MLALKFGNLAVLKQWDLTGFDDKHRPDKRWLLDVLATYCPGDDIFKKDYLPPAKATKLSTIKSREVPKDFIEGLPQSQRRVRRKGLRMQKAGLRIQKKERFKMMTMNHANAFLSAEVKDS